eukprot:gnl/TRDRNA2_/TRDRNA2_161962_c0_seq2.p1 gnl/TRDRNA2_/TRDRNA2_161962_c0~~gnl/TRDRNA2_/TRDRNA2_161962_c0_seq2.p1  ORF type:complete len:123 (-),score=8.24 gnl/TRDRNA2_/TRDRNA2_161962_c0_seq2:138-506(-)
MNAAVNYYRAAGTGLWPSFKISAIPELPVQALRILQGISSEDVSAASSADRTLYPSAENCVIQAPVLVLWGRRDPYLGEELATPPRNCVPNLTGPKFLDATHWVHWDQPGQVNDELLRFLRS